MAIFLVSADAEIRMCFYEKVWLGGVNLEDCKLFNVKKKFEELIWEKLKLAKGAASNKNIWLN